MAHSQPRNQSARSVPRTSRAVGFSDLPADVVAEIFDHFSLADKGRFAQVNQVTALVARTVKIFSRLSHDIADEKDIALTLEKQFCGLDFTKYTVHDLTSFARFASAYNERPYKLASLKLGGWNFREPPAGTLEAVLRIRTLTRLDFSCAGTFMLLLPDRTVLEGFGSKISSALTNLKQLNIEFSSVDLDLAGIRGLRALTRLHINQSMVPGETVPESLFTESGAPNLLDL